ncbi:MAG: helix-turn-helix domain-containing protein [Bacteroidales bacterium]|jgi:hypothetical protein|nr:helix-turn-helix domain-containing protein [Bacteroidales bacterium]
MDISQLENGTLLICKKEDLLGFAESLANRMLNSKPEPLRVQETEQPISQPDAIKFLGKTRQTLTAWRKKGIITGHVLGGRVYFLKSELLEALTK